MTSADRPESIRRRFVNVLGVLLDPNGDRHDRMEFVFQETVKLLEVGEEGIAFENLVENLYELDIPIDGSLMTEIRRLGEELCIDPSVWRLLESRTAIVPGAHDEIRTKLIAGCGEEDFAKMRCPVCESSLTLSVHRDGRKFFVRCSASSAHLGFHEEAESPQPWFVSMASGSGWYS